MKKFLIAAAATIVALSFYAAYTFYSNNLRGIGPALRPPAGDITAQIPPTTIQPPTSSGPSPVASDIPLKLPEGFAISLYAKDLNAPRVMAFDNAGQLLVSIPSLGQVVALVDVDYDGFAETHRTVLSGLDKPHGLAMRCTDICRLYVAETSQLVVYDYASFDGQAAEAVNPRKLADLPTGGNHVTRSLLFLPAPEDATLLISIGSTCNVCHEADDRRAKVLALDVEQGGQPREYARGLRNSVFMALHPVSGQVWATEMGRDLLGDDIPPDEINIVADGKNYGWPNCYGQNVHDDDFDKNVYIRNPCMEPFEMPAKIDLQAHSAPLGLAFVPEEGWPEEYWYNALVAFHGSWNRSVPTGYKLVRIKLDADGNHLGTEDFITGWLKPGDKAALGRPADVMALPGGTVFISDDKAGVVYKITRTNEPN